MMGWVGPVFNVEPPSIGPQIHKLICMQVLTRAGEKLESWGNSCCALPRKSSKATAWRAWFQNAIQDALTLEAQKNQTEIKWIFKGVKTADW